MNKLSDSLRKMNAASAEGMVLPVTARRPEVLQCPQVPKPLHGVAPRIVMGQQWWDVVRKAAYASTGFHCIACGVHRTRAKYRQWLEAHELYLIDYRKGTMTYVEAIPLCHFCHNYIHNGRLEALRDQGKLSLAKYVAIIRHGNKVLRAANLFKPDPYDGPMAEWGDWRLILDGKEYPPRFSSFEEWEHHYANLHVDED